MYGCRTVYATGAVVHRGNVQLVLVPFKRYGLRVQTDHAGDLFDDKLSGRRATTDEPESENDSKTKVGKFNKKKKMNFYKFS